MRCDRCSQQDAMIHLEVASGFRLWILRKLVLQRVTTSAQLQRRVSMMRSMKGSRGPPVCPFQAIGGSKFSSTRTDLHVDIASSWVDFLPVRARIHSALKRLGNSSLNSAMLDWTMLRPFFRDLFNEHPFVGDSKWMIDVRA